MDNLYYVEKIIDKLEKSGYKAYIVGGAVRDMVLGVPPHDYDIATSASPQEVAEVFDKVINTGEKYGTVTVIIDDFKCEVTRFRTESDYQDSRHPLYIMPAESIEEDLSRRDFTINAMAYNKNRGIVDPFGGYDDLKEGVIRAVGNPKKRFLEDALRILRAYRFASRLEFRIEPVTLDAIHSASNQLQNISIERIAAELLQILSGKDPAVLIDLIKCGGLDFLSLKADSLKILHRCENNILIRFVAFAMVCGRKSADLAKELCLSNQFCKDCDFVESVVREDKLSPVTIKRHLRNSSFDLMRVALSARKDILDTDISVDLKAVDLIEQNGEPYTIAHLDVSGDDIAKLGFSGKEIGDKLELLLENVLVCPENNRKEILLDLAK